MLLQEYGRKRHMLFNGMVLFIGYLLGRINRMAIELKRDAMQARRALDNTTAKEMEELSKALQLEKNIIFLLLALVYLAPLLIQV